MTICLVWNVREGHGRFILVLEDGFDSVLEGEIFRDLKVG
jgi:hypothetical protein